MNPKKKENLSWIYWLLKQVNLLNVQPIIHHYPFRTLSYVFSPSIFLLSNSFTTYNSVYIKLAHQASPSRKLPIGFNTSPCGHQHPRVLSLVYQIITPSICPPCRLISSPLATTYHESFAYFFRTNYHH